MSDGSVETTISHLLRELAPQVLAALTRRHGDFAAAEDAMQDALIAASQQWLHDGIPDNPRGWLYHVAVRRMTDQIRSDMARRHREDAVATELWAEWAFVPSAASVVDVEDDDSLTLLFMCCHPALTRTSAVALTLRAVGGLTTAEIASAFLVPESTMAQRISRAKETIRSSGIAFAIPAGDAHDDALAAVLRVLYLIFSEGYASSSGDAVLRPDLTREAIRLARGVHERLPEVAEASGLLALMLLTDARRSARTGAEGELIALDQQDRSRWDRAMITEGTVLLQRALPRGPTGMYQIQAAIAAVHDEASEASATDWPQIVALYGVLMALADNPVVALNHAIAVAMVRGPAAGLALLDAVAADPRMQENHRVDAARGHLHEMAGDRIEARRCYLSAAAGTASEQEREYLVRKAL